MTTDRTHPRYARWPIAFGFARHTATNTFDRHGWWTKAGYGQTLHFGPFKVYLGHRRDRRKTRLRLR